MEMVAVNNAEIGQSDDVGKLRSLMLRIPPYKCGKEAETNHFPIAAIHISGVWFVVNTMCGFHVFNVHTPFSHI